MKRILQDVFLEIFKRNDSLTSVMKTKYFTYLSLQEKLLKQPCYFILQITKEQYEVLDKLPMGICIPNKPSNHDIYTNDNSFFEALSRYTSSDIQTNSCFILHQHAFDQFIFKIKHCFTKEELQDYKIWYATLHEEWFKIFMDDEQWIEDMKTLKGEYIEDCQYEPGQFYTKFQTTLDEDINTLQYYEGHYYLDEVHEYPYKYILNNRSLLRFIEHLHEVMFHKKIKPHTILLHAFQNLHDLMKELII